MSSVALIGNFDGVHVGHQGLIKKAVELSEARSAVELLCFTPHTGMYFGRKKFFVLSPSLRGYCLNKLGVVRVNEVPFHEVVNMNPMEFVKEVLFNQMGVKCVVVGENFRFGKDRKGDVEDLRSLCRACGMEAVSVPVVDFGGIRVSCSAVGKFIEEGKMDLVAGLMGRCWTVEGDVMRGKGIGKKLSFPTANLSMDGLFVPPLGVYSGYVQVLGEDEVYGAAVSIGRRPTVEEKGEVLLEAHILGFDVDRVMTGKGIRVSVRGFIRDEERFPTVDLMVEQMKKDVARVAAELEQVETPSELW